MTQTILPYSCAMIILFVILQGCSSNRMYSWGKYDTTLYQHYKSPQEKEAHLERLAEIVKNAEDKNKVPPGLFAEYGYALYEIGKISEAITYFEKEKAKWPESNVLMTKMINNAKRQQEILKKSPASTSVGGQEASK